MEYHWALRAGCQGEDTHPEYTNCRHVGKAPQPSLSICHAYSLHRVACKRTHREDIGKDNTKMAFTSMVPTFHCSCSPPGNKPPFFFLMCIHFVAWSHDKLEFIHSFNKNVLVVSYVSGTVSDKENTVVGGGKNKNKTHALSGLTFWEEQERYKQTLLDDDKCYREK